MHIRVSRFGLVGSGVRETGRGSGSGSGHRVRAKRTRTPCLGLKNRNHGPPSDSYYYY